MIKDFVIYLEGLKLKLDIENKKERYRNFYSKRRPELRAEIFKYNNISDIQKSFIFLAKKIENAEKVIRNFYNQIIGSYQKGTGFYINQD